LALNIELATSANGRFLRNTGTAMPFVKYVRIVGSFKAIRKKRERGKFSVFLAANGNDKIRFLKK